MLLTVSVFIKELPSDPTVLYSSLSAIGGAITGSAIMYFAQKKLQIEERKTRLAEKKIECYGEILRCYRSSVFFYEHHQKWAFDYKEFNEKVTPEIEKYYFYLPVQVQTSIDIMKDFERDYLYDGIPESAVEEVYQEKVKFLYESIKFIEEEYKDFAKEYKKLFDL